MSWVSQLRSRVKQLCPHTIVVFVLSLSFFLVGLYHIANTYSFDSDSGREYYRAYQILQGASPDEGAFILQFLYAVVLWVTDYNYDYLRGVQLLFGSLIIWISYQWISVIIGRKSLYALAFPAILMTSPLFMILSTQAKPYMMVLFLVMYYLFRLTKGLASKKLTLSQIIIDNTILGLAILTKNHAYVFLVSPAMYFLLRTVRGESVWVNLRNCLISYAVVAAWIGPMIIYAYSLVGDRFWHYPNTWIMQYNGLKNTELWNHPGRMTAERYLTSFRQLIANWPVVLLSLLAVIGLPFQRIRSYGYVLGVFALSLPVLIPFILSRFPPNRQYTYFLVPLLLVLFCFSGHSRIIWKRTIWVVSAFVVIANLTFFSSTAALRPTSGVYVEELREVREFLSGGNKVLTRGGAYYPYLGKIELVTVSTFTEPEGVRFLAWDDAYEVLSNYEVDFILLHNDLTWERAFYSAWTRRYYGFVPSHFEEIKTDPNFELIHVGNLFSLYKVL